MCIVNRVLRNLTDIIYLAVVHNREQVQPATKQAKI